MKSILLVSLGGFLGSAARYASGVWCLQHFPHPRFPYSTFAVNVVGCFLAGVLTGVMEQWRWLDPQARLFLITGVLGGFTTFSAFGLEAMLLLRRGEAGVAAAYAIGSVVLGVAAVWCGMKGVELLASRPS
jgi:CrcB protein